jgi:hypothetical protein
LGIDPFPTSDLRLQHVLEKISTRATTLVQTLLRLNSAVGSYEPPKSRDSNRDNFWTPTWESQQNVPFGENIIWGKVVASPKSGLWWIKWIQGCSWLVPTPKRCKMNFNQLVVGFDADSSKWIACPLPSLITGLLAHPCTPL